MKISFLSWLSFFFCYYWACLSFSVSLVSGHSVHCLQDQKLLLLQLKKNLKFNPIDSIKLVCWNESVPCSEWRGHQRFEELSFFEFVECWLCEPNTNGDCSALKVTILDLSTLYPYFEESALKLESPNLVKLVQNLSEVRELYLDSINIALNGNEWGHTLSSFLPHLQVLSMSSCNLSGPIHSSLKKLQNISIIRLDDNNLSAAVPSFFSKFSNLTKLDLSFCNLRGQFVNKIFQLQSLTSLDLTYNHGLQGSLPYFPQNRSLKTLILSMTNFSGALPGSISNLRQLSRLEISRCQFNGTLPDSMSNLIELTYLDLSCNNFTGTMPSFGMANKLTHIDLSQNKLNGGVVSAHFKGLEKLVSINLQKNFLNGSIPVSLFLLPLLQSIQLSDNHLSQGQLDAISNIPSSTLQVLDLSSNYLRGPTPEFIFDLKGLEVLQLSSNKFHGTLRLDKFERLRHLTTLGLSNNNLSIDTNVRNANLLSFPNMSTLMLASCNLRQFPGSLRNMSSLTYLDLSNNKIAEKIPKWIWEFGYLSQLNLSHNSMREIERTPQTFISNSLFVLDLHDNCLQGTLPTFPPLASYLDYSYNKFICVIPPDIGNYLSTTFFLSLSHNALYERIPDSICNASYLQVLDLSNNNFSGVIPHCLAKSKTLGVLNLGKNNLSGNIPDTFQASCTLRTLDLSSNNLQGTIPKSMSHCTTLEVLDIGNNKINGEFPCLLKTIPTLQVMVLRRNNFHGHIGCPNMKRMIWKMLQIVDLAFNNFSGMLPGECFHTWKAMMLDKNETSSKANQINFNFFGNEWNYQDQVIGTTKGQEMILTKILTVFMSIDFSSNCIEGSIPEEMMGFTALHVLNLSNNNMLGHIPSSIWKLQQLESLDLSNNSLTGEIPSQLASLSFLSFVNLSYNHLVGKIPTGTQLQSFEASSFQGNDALYGPPLTQSPNNGPQGPMPPPTSANNHAIDFEFIKGLELGVIFGLGIIIGPLFFWRRWTIRYWRCVDSILCSIFPQIYVDYRSH
ncbi:hypothetical protein K1719_012982 [Acacia pycnantha]|nr:hypothetical protein K1719_012982 [Acacia pycnantha]